MILFVGICSLIMDIIIWVIFRAPSPVTVVAVSQIVTMCAVLMFIANRYNAFRVVTYLTIILLCDIMLPFIFFNLGGKDSGIAAYIVLSAVVIFFLVTGTARIFFFATNLFVVGACYYIGFTHPEFVNALSDTEMVIDQIQASAISGFYIGLLNILQKMIMNAETEKVSNALNELTEHEKLLLAVNNTAETLIVANVAGARESIHGCMAKIGETIEIDRIVIWRYVGGDDGARFSCELFWESDAIAEKYPIAKIIPGFPYIQSHPTRQKAMRSGDYLNLAVSKLPPEERALFDLTDVKSTLFAPIHMDGAYWGFVTFDDCNTSSEFPKGEISILKSCGLLMASALERSETVERLATSREEALRGTRAKSDFLANMSHEIRTPLNAVIGMTSIGLSSPLTERKDYCFNKIEDASAHLLGVINDILDMSKIEANKLELSPAPFEFEKLLQHVVNVSSFRIDEKDQHFIVYLDEKIPPMFIGDDQRLAQVLTNLLSNAAKFTPAGGSIEMNAHLIEEKDGICKLRFEVKDTGIGISDEQKEKLFTSFQQADSSTSRNFGGTGLGLAISKRIVEMMGGDIQVESEPERGSNFSFTVFLKRAESETMKKRQKRLAGVNFKNLRILFVDDDSDIREYFCDIAERFGFACDYASGGYEALELVRANEPYDICFFDWKMPGMDGLELAKAIRGTGDSRSIIVMVSAYELTEVEAVARAAGVDRFLPKPLFPSAIADLIAECIGAESIVNSVQEITADLSGFDEFHLLLAEDVEINREIVMTLLEPMSLKIECAMNGKQALEIFREDPSHFDLILMDVQMPEMDGIEATRRIRALDVPEAKAIPIIAMTANVFREDVEQCLEAGMNEHLGKPIDFEGLFSVLRKHLIKPDGQHMSAR
ncbi:MAG: response regulator [Clostridiales Family XIII bacterium]|nr:response regulator [Clostridiales Family XIII bacterium]